MSIDLLRRLTLNRPHLLVVLATLINFSAAYWASFILRFEFSIPAHYSIFIVSTLPWILLIKLGVFYANGIYRILWAYVGIKDLYRILLASVFSTGLIAITNLVFLPNQLIPRSVLVLDGLFTFLSVGGVYAFLRSLREANARMEGYGSEVRQPALIIGAGDAGEALLRELQRNRASAVKVVGFLDDAANKVGSSLRGVRVLGSVADAGRIAEDLDVRKAFIAIPSAPGATIRKLVTTLLAAKLAIKILPPLTKLSAEAGYVTQLREVSIEDLLRREPVKLDMATITGSIRDKVVLVTGAAGSIGSELCRQILEHHPSKLVALDLAESPLHALLLELEGSVKGSEIASELADVTDASRIRGVLKKYSPSVVFHAAALKHVPMMEAHPQEAVRVNIHGTRIVAEACKEAKVSSFILISTDKAVNPTSVMGASKRLAELLLRRLSEEGSSTRFIAVRFGNVLGSNGSVLPIFKAQLAKGGPLTVTHPEMRRYFMTIPEAVQLVIQASVLGSGGEVFVLDMGEPIYIKDFAADLIRLSGLVPEVDIKIEYSGLRPGEKLFEEIRLDSEVCKPTEHPQILCLRSEALSERDWSAALDASLGRDRDHAGVELQIRKLLQPGLPTGSRN